MLRERAQHPHHALPHGRGGCPESSSSRAYPFPTSSRDPFLSLNSAYNGLQGNPAMRPANIEPTPSRPPQQYAYPFQYYSQERHSAEHLLRRKTPNGTFNAAYDGSSPNWSQSHQPSKHLLMPVSKFSTSKPMASSLQQNGSVIARTPPQYYQPTSTREHSLQTESKAVTEQRYPVKGPLRSNDQVYLNGDNIPYNGVNSLLDPSAYHRLPFNSHATIPTVLQPLWPPSSRPTSMQAPLPVGPYWPDGAFEPYRPTPLCRTKPNDVPHDPARNANAHLYHRDLMTENEGPQSLKYSATDLLSDSQNSHGKNQHMVHKNSSHDDMVCNGSLPSDFHAKLAISKDRGKMEWSISRDQSQFVTLAAPAVSSQAHFKERILTWAHRIYCNLLTTIETYRREQNAVYDAENPSSSQRPRRPYPSWSSKRSRPVWPIISEDALTPTNTVLQDRQRSSLQPASPPYSTAGRDISASGSSKVQTGQESVECLNQQQYSVPASPHQYHRTYHPATFSGYVPRHFDSAIEGQSPFAAAHKATEILNRLCQESQWQWIDGMLLNGCLAYGLGEYAKATKLYLRVLRQDPENAEAMSNLAATLLSLGRRQEAEKYWMQVVRQRPWYFEAVEHLVGLLHEENRGKETVNVIELVERSLRIDKSGAGGKAFVTVPVEASVGSFAVPPADRGRLLALIHGKGNVLYQSGDNDGAAKAFEDAILIGTGAYQDRIRGLVKHLIMVFTEPKSGRRIMCTGARTTDQPILLPPEVALEAARLAFPPFGNLPGLEDVPSGMAQKAAVSIVSNALLSLAKIYQDCMSSNGAPSLTPRATSGVPEILALYYLSLSLQPSPSTANNVGILLAGVQQPSTAGSVYCSSTASAPGISGVVPGSGVALALAYYDYGLKLDARHAHLYTNLGSLFKDIGQLSPAIKMYEKAVECDPNFDIALANLANAVKDRGNIRDAIQYYKRAVKSNPDFAEAVCGLANALNSVCNWAGRGGISSVHGTIDRWHVDENGLLFDSQSVCASSSGWMDRVISIVQKQLSNGRYWGQGVLDSNCKAFTIRQLQHTTLPSRDPNIGHQLSRWAGVSWEGAKIVRLIERATKVLTWLVYHQEHHPSSKKTEINRQRPQLPSTLTVPSAPTVLPFHTFTCPLSAKEIRLISQRNGLRVSCATLKAPWLSQRIYGPPPPPKPHLNVGYISSDFNNHPLAHLMQSVFGIHDASRVRAICYATTASDGSVHRKQIERESPAFYDCSGWSIDQIVNQVVDDQVHILVNLNGYTRGAKNEVFAARPAPIQMSFMGFAGTLGAEWCDYLLGDEITIPPRTLRPARQNFTIADQVHDGNLDDSAEKWVYCENVVFTKDTFFCCDHRQSAADAFETRLTWKDEQRRRWQMRKEVFPHLADDMIILGNFNQLYKIDPTTFRSWLRILSRVPKAVLWLLRFPELGEHHLRATALQWVGAEVASRLVFTDVAPKQQHISRATICDLFVDTPECNAHTTAADVLWSGTPLLTYSRYEYKMCSRIAASILRSALPKNAEGDRAASDLIATSEETYEEQGVELASDLVYSIQGDEVGYGRGRLIELRKLLFDSRWTSALFDTRRWVRDLEDAYSEAWRRWVAGESGDIYL